MNKKKFVSCVIPVYNNYMHVEKCLNSVLKQSKKFDEIIVADDGSTDGTKELVKKYPVKLLELKHFGRSHARNQGWKKSKGNIVFFGEIDAVYSRNFLKECLKKLEKENIGSVIGKQLVLNENDSVWTKCKQFERKAAFQNYRPFSGWLYKRKVLEKTKGFDEKLDFGEDVDLSKRMQKFKWHVAYADKAVWKHFEPPQLSNVLKRAWNFGFNMNSFYKKHGYPKAIFLDLIFFTTILLGFANVFFWILTDLFLLGKLFINRNIFKNANIKMWPALIVFILSQSIVFKFSRLLGIMLKGGK